MGSVLFNMHILVCSNINYLCRQDGSMIMKVIIAGSRTLTDYELIKQLVIESRFDVTEVVNGMAYGVDLCGVCYALEFDLPVKNFPPDYKKYQPKVAPIIRNGEMADYADAAVIIIENFSKGSHNMMHQMNRRKKRFYTVFLNEGTDKKKFMPIMDPLTEKDHRNGRALIGKRTKSSLIKNEVGGFRFL